MPPCRWLLQMNRKSPVATFAGHGIIVRADDDGVVVHALMVRGNGPVVAAAVPDARTDVTVKRAALVRLDGDCTAV